MNHFWAMIKITPPICGSQIWSRSTDRQQFTHSMGIHKTFKPPSVFSSWNESKSQTGHCRPWSNLSHWLFWVWIYPARLISIQKKMVSSTNYSICLFLSQKNEAKNKKNISLFCPSNWEIPNLLQELNGYFTQKRQPFSWLTARGDWTEPHLLEDEKSSRPAGLSEGSL